ncbi:DUF2461 domain-containing protein [Flavobacteriales bacterium]|nr:DUF2461 domain-containing protein [Flavobacteriales bacterium]
MANLNTEFFNFFMDLAPNNNKDWFDQNRKRYKTFVKEPFDRLVGEVIEKIHEIDNQINCESKDCIFRINRDIRFSKDKTLYKMNRSAVISSGGKKRKDIPGVYFEIDCEKVRIYGGAYAPNKDQLQQIREEITLHTEIFNQLILDSDFVDTFGFVRGEKNTRIPKEFKDFGEHQPLIYNKQFYWFAEYPPDTALKDNFTDLIAAHYSIMKPLNDFFIKPIINH